METAGYVIEDIRTVDERLQDGIQVSSALYLLSDSYGYLEKAGQPPGVDAADYFSRLRTLGSFAESAGDEYDDDPMNGTARYEVVRIETGKLFDQLNKATGSHLRLP